jgi:hypothetical protein
VSDRLTGPIPEFRRERRRGRAGERTLPGPADPKRGLRQVDFIFDGNEIPGLEQNPETKSRWAQLARSGKKVMRFLSEVRYVVNVFDGKVTLYAR